MKKLFLTLAATALIFSSYAQLATEKEDLRVLTVSVLDAGEFSKDTIINNDEINDTVRIKFGKKGLSVIEKEGKTIMEWDDLDVDSDVDIDEEEESEPSWSDFSPHWSSFRMGLNNFVNSDYSMSLDPAINYMDLNTGKSWNFDINFMQYGIGLGTDKIGLVTGLGLELNNYYFDKGNNIIENADGNIESFDITISKPNASVQKSKLRTTYLTVPLLLELQIPAGKERIILSGGVVGGVKIGSKSKMVYTVNGDKQKDKVKDDFNLAPLRYGYTAQIGFKDISIYATYYPTALFENNRGPELYPFSIGISLIDF
jgi:Outer membrane protein beta-barrel domain